MDKTSRETAPQVLIFGDSTLDIQGLKTVLTENGYSTDILSNPIDELGDAVSEHVKLIFLDVPYLNRIKTAHEPLISRCREVTLAHLVAMLAPDSPRDFFHHWKGR